MYLSALSSVLELGNSTTSRFTGETLLNFRADVQQVSLQGVVRKVKWPWTTFVTFCSKLGGTSIYHSKISIKKFALKANVQVKPYWIIWSWTLRMQSWRKSCNFYSSALLLESQCLSLGLFTDIFKAGIDCHIHSVKVTGKPFQQRE